MEKEIRRPSSRWCSTRHRLAAEGGQDEGRRGLDPSPRQQPRPLAPGALQWGRASEVWRPWPRRGAALENARARARGLGSSQSQTVPWAMAMESRRARKTEKVLRNRRILITCLPPLCNRRLGDSDPKRLTKKKSLQPTHGSALAEGMGDGASLSPSQHGGAGGGLAGGAGGAGGGGLTSSAAAAPEMAVDPRVPLPKLPGPSHTCRPSWPHFMADMPTRDKVSDIITAYCGTTPIMHRITRQM